MSFGRAIERWLEWGDLLSMDFSVDINADGALMLVPNPDSFEDVEELFFFGAESGFEQDVFPLLQTHGKIRTDGIILIIDN